MTRRIIIVWTLAVACACIAQESGVPREFLEDRRRVEGDHLTFCIHEQGLLAEFDRAIAREIGNVLLVDVAFEEVTPPRVVPPFDYRIPLLYEEIYVFLTDDCDAFMGFTLTSTGYPEWMILSRAYLETRFVLATTDEAYESLQDIPEGVRIGTRQVSVADIAFSEYVRSLPEGARWQRTPYPYDQLLIEALLEGRLDAALVWEPALHAATEGDPEAQGIRVIPSDPVDLPMADFGIALRARSEYIRTLLDDAIVALIEAGVVEAILQEHGLPGTPGSLGR